MKEQESVSRTTSICFLIILLLVLVGVWILFLIGVRIDVPLSGVTPNTERPDTNHLLIDTWDGTFQSKLNTYITDHFPSRSLYIKLANTLKWCLFHKSGNLNIIVGDERTLYEEWYLHEYYMTDAHFFGENNREEIKSIVRDLSFICNKLKEMGKEVYVFITPNKVDYYSEEAPTYYKITSKREEFNSVRNIDVLLDELDEFDIPYFNTKTFFEKINDDIFPFSRQGTHYSWAPAYLAIQEFFRQIEVETDLDLPAFQVDVASTTEPQYPDTDIYDLLNMVDSIARIPYGKLTFYKGTVSCEEKEFSPVRIFVQGGSFIGPFIALFRLDIPQSVGQLDYVQNKVADMSSGYRDLQSMDDVDYEAAMNNDLFIFEVNEYAANTFSFDCIPHFRAYLESMESVK